MDNRRAFMFFVLLFFLLSAPEPRQPSFGFEQERDRLKAEEQHALSYLNNSTYGSLDSASDRWLPLGGLTKDDGYAWGLLPVIKDRARTQLQSILQRSGLMAELPQAWQAKPLPADINITELQLPLYHNVTGKVRGDWVRQQGGETDIRPNLNTTDIMLRHDYFTHEFTNNITADHGTLQVDLHENEYRGLALDGSSAREIRAEMTLNSDESLGDSHFIRLFGVHFPTSGGIILTTSSEKFAGLSALPQFALSKDTFELSRQLLNKSLSATLSEQRNGPVDYLPWSSLPHGPSSMTYPSPKCEYVVYLQQHPVAINGQLAQPSSLELIEQELRFPNGAPINAPPLMVMSMALFSPDCGFVIESKSSPEYSPLDGLYLSGPKQEQYSIHAGRLVVIMAAIFSAQIFVLMRQMKAAQSPPARSRVSFYTIAMMSMGDAIFGSFVLTQLFSEAPFLLLTATTFLAFFSVSFLAMKFKIEVWAVQAPERRGADRSSVTRTTPSPGSSPALPLPATTARPVDTGATPIVLPPDQDEPAETPANRNGVTGDPVDTGAMYSRFYFILFCLMFFSSWTLFWPSTLSRLYGQLLSVVYLSFWIPQIYRNVMRNCRKSLTWEFMAFESIVRLSPFLYLYFISGNVLFINTGTIFTLVVVVWVWMQILVLAAQDLFGARFFVPHGWAPEVYDYHPILRDTSASGSATDLEAAGTLPIGSLRAEEHDPSSSNVRDGNKETNDGGNKRLFDCAICMQSIAVPVLTETSSSGRLGTIVPSSLAEGAANALNRRAYMVTPCRHIFHTTCLESWMHRKLQCPICRETIPVV
ncbi:hypothetical protein FQN55_009136 [Onygenales sp. PD_40]|nr:hypothetical protein FQN55_009136 [Onygenales sp. PD_40]